MGNDCLMGIQLLFGVMKTTLALDGGGDYMTWWIYWKQLNCILYIKVKCELYLNKTKKMASLVVQWLRIALQCRGHWFDPWSRKIWHTSWQLGLCPTNNEPGLWSSGTTTTGALAPQQEKPLWWEAHVPQLESSPRLLQLKKARAAMKTQYSKNK